jgi:Na+/H+-translocating membrane pyrophosphatase
MFLVCARSVRRIKNDLFATIVVEICDSMVLKNLIVCFLWTVFARADSSGNFMFPLVSDSHVFCIVPEVAMFLVCARSVRGIMNDLFSTIVAKLVLSVTFKN